MTRPSFQFYPGDWQSNSNLRRCTHEEKGLWLEVLCLLHDQEDYGVSRWPLTELAQAAGTTVAKLRILAAKGVLKGADEGETCAELVYVPRSGRKNGEPVMLIDAQPGPIWYSSRMVVDEHKRVLRGEGGFGSAGAPDHSPKGGFGATPKQTPDDAPEGAPDHTPSTCAGASRAAPSSSSSSSSSNVNKKTKAPAAPSFDPRPDLVANGVGEQTAVDWLALRAKKRAPVTPTVLSQLVHQAALAGMSLDDTLALCCVRGWTGFEASWVQKAGQANGPLAIPKFNPTAHVNRHRSAKA